jgi:hypothetical protein
MQNTPEEVLRVCKKCGETKNLAEFVKTKACTLGHSHTCKVCNWKIRAPQYAKDRRKRADQENKKNRDKKSYMVNKMGNKCYDCGNSYPDCVYDFHHLDPSQKDFKLSSVRSMDLELIDKELSKCVMLCSNCHRVRHWLPREGE